MLSDRVVSFLRNAVDEGFSEDHVWELFDSYVALYVDGELDELEKDIDYHQARFRRFLLHNSDPTSTPRRVTPAKTDTQRRTSTFPKQHQVYVFHSVVMTTANSSFDSVFFAEEEGALKNAFFSPTASEDQSKDHIHQMRKNAMREALPEEEEMNDLMFALWMVFGIRSFRGKQEEIVNSVLAGHDTFVLMPTGGGKSLCYQGLTVVVSPLLSLVQDQVCALLMLPCGGVPTTYLNSHQTEIERRDVYKEIANEEVTCKLLYVTPEQLTRNATLIRILQRQQKMQNFSRMVIDEAHCVSMWGHDFRPAYAELGTVKSEKFPGLQTVALTATANEKVKNDIVQCLDMSPSIREFQMSFYRENLKFMVIGKGSFGKGIAMLKKYINSKQRGSSGIVYCLSKKECEDVAQSVQNCNEIWMLLNDSKIRAGHYHAGMDPTEREKVQSAWMEGCVDVVVATIAFGMGIDHPRVRFVIHFVLPKSLENYYQEAGRAGRDGLRSECILFYSGKDVGRLKLLIRRNNPDYKKGYELIDRVRDYCTNDRDCRHSLLLKYLDEEMDPPTCGSNCHVCCIVQQGMSMKDQCPWSVVTETEIASANRQAQSLSNSGGAEGSSY